MKRAEESQERADVGVLADEDELVLGKVDASGLGVDLMADVHHARDISHALLNLDVFMVEDGVLIYSVPQLWRQGEEAEMPLTRLVFRRNSHG